MAEFKDFERPDGCTHCCLKYDACMVVIKDFKIPDRCVLCPLKYETWGRHKFCNLTGDSVNAKLDRLSECPLIEVEVNEDRDA